jgi:hypothetical protein
MKIIRDTVLGAKDEIYNKEETEILQIKDFAKVMQKAFAAVGWIVAEEDEAAYAEWYEKRGEIVWGEIARNFVDEFTISAETIELGEVQKPKKTKKKEQDKKAPGAKAPAKGPKKALSTAEKVAVKEMSPGAGRRGARPPGSAPRRGTPRARSRRPP